LFHIARAAYVPVPSFRFDFESAKADQQELSNSGQTDQEIRSYTLPVYPKFTVNQMKEQARWALKCETDPSPKSE
jgi:hypothetical protein